MWRNGSVKKERDSVKKGKCDDKGEQKPYIQFLCTAHLYSTKHTVVLAKHTVLMYSSFVQHQTYSCFN